MSKTLSDITGAEVWVKFENFQFTAAFKERGALNKLLLLTEAERRNGVIAMSAGNHAQGVALAAAKLDCKAIIVMAHELGIQVVAEGIETEGQRALLAAAGCDYGQGYLFSRPLSVADFESAYPR